ncbi:hypothetical protein AB0M48_38805 [Lentzea sp. NPDC051208]|uniref:hypothetical protein n=1 Tax=Lentzea sp. NPDC051208 TaxID=3154642 RepID=UPI003421588D
MDFHEVKQRLFVDGALEDVKAIHDELTGIHADQELSVRWETLRSAFETNRSAHEWSPWAAHLIAYLDVLPVDERMRAVEHQEALLDGLIMQILAAYQAEEAHHQAGHTAETAVEQAAEQAASPRAFSAQSLWSALVTEMERKARMGDVPEIPGSARAVARKLVEVGWYAALGQHTASDTFETWVHRCLETAQRNIGVDLGRPEVLEVLRADTGGAFAALRRASGPIAERLTAAAAEQKDRARRPASRRTSPEPDDDPLDGASLRILFGEADIETILEDDELSTAFQGLVGAGLELTFEELD